MSSQLKVLQFVQRSIDEGYVKTAEEAVSMMFRQVNVSFVKKLKEQGIDTSKLKDSRVFAGMSKKYDSLLIGFGGKYFDVHINYELLEAGLDPHVFVLVVDQSKILEYRDLEFKTTRNQEPVALQYERPRKELLN